MNRLRAALESLDEAISDLGDVIAARQNQTSDRRIHVDKLAHSLDDVIGYLDHALSCAQQ